MADERSRQSRPRRSALRRQTRPLRSPQASPQRLRARRRRRAAGRARQRQDRLRPRRGAARSVSIGRVTSPTFAIGNVYSGSEAEVAHLDLYRLAEIDVADEAVLDDFLTPERIGFVEWPHDELADADRACARSSRSSTPAAISRAIEIQLDRRDARDRTGIRHLDGGLHGRAAPRRRRALRAAAAGFAADSKAGAHAPSCCRRFSS